MELIFLPSDLNPSLGLVIFQCGAIELCEFLVELIVREESIQKSVNRGFLVAKRDGNLLTVKASNIVMERLIVMLLDTKEVT